MIEIQSRAHRILKPLASYCNLDKDGGKLPQGFPSGLALGAAEQPLGIYTLDAEEYSDAVLFTTDGLHLRQGQAWLSLQYHEIGRIVFPPEKSDVTGLFIERQDSSRFWLPIKGTTGGRFYDAFEVLRFLDRVRSDFANRQS